MRNFFNDIMGMTVLQLFEAAVEILIFALVFYVILRFLHGSRGLGIMKGVLALVAVLLMALLIFQWEGVGGVTLPRISLVADTFLTATLLALVVVFQPEIRRGLSRLGEVEIFSRTDDYSYSPLVQGIIRLARKRIGAIIVIERSVGLNSYTEGGVKVNSEISAPILESIFFPRSPLHDGAILVRRNRIFAASRLMPLSEKTDLPSELGTRHRAALGITEESDAVAVVVSEETGKIRVAYRGELIPAQDSQQLEAIMNDILLEGAGGEESL